MAKRNSRKGKSASKDIANKLLDGLLKKHGTITLRGTAGTGKTAVLKAFAQSAAEGDRSDQEVAARAALRNSFPQSSGVSIIGTSAEPPQISDEFGSVMQKRMSRIVIPPMDMELRNDLVMKVIAAGKARPADGVTEKKIAATLRQKAFKDASVRDALQMLQDKGLLVRKPAANPPKPR